MNTLNVIIVDDEFSARNVLKNLLLRNCPNINIIDTCENVLDAVKSIKKYQPDIVFLDIQMPNYNGYELINFIDNINFEIIFVTAYDQYALKAFELNATDYLLKPINRLKLKEAVQKVVINKEKTKKYEHYLDLIDTLKDKVFKQFIVSTTEGKKVIKFNNLVSIKGEGSYSVLHFNDGDSLITSKNLKHYQEVLSVDNRFYRCHKSWIINLNLLKSLNTTLLQIEMENNQSIKLSKSKRSEIQILVSNI